MRRASDGCRRRTAELKRDSGLRRSRRLRRGRDRGQTAQENEAAHHWATVFITPDICVAADAVRQMLAPRLAAFALITADKPVPRVHPSLIAMTAPVAAVVPPNIATGVVAQLVPVPEISVKFTAAVTGAMKIEQTYKFLAATPGTIDVGPVAATLMFVKVGAFA